MTRSITLEERDEAFVSGRVASGRYSDASQVVRDALRLLDERERRRAALDAALDKGLADVAAQRVTPIDDVGNRWSARYDAMVKSAACGGM